MIISLHYQDFVKNVSLLESVLSERGNAINYHAVPAAEFKEDAKTNLADLLAKILLAKILPVPLQHELLGSMMYKASI